VEIDGDNRRGSSTTRRLNRDQVTKMRGRKNFIGKRKKSVFNTFLHFFFSQWRDLKTTINQSDLQSTNAVKTAENFFLSL